ncbi:hypothetical protein [Streptomyces bohaiensis]|uniref:Ferrous iron transport protein A n=1 Tax=Streptomyces bohaiensis TaxID=1431344 RepID=A0ABX1C9X8_9ACTN|nr:hypothetical protein [Streptomyces bohaiensis]NJQ14713.1 hypothetical protein [Streptomyces bohaiensis]
MRARSLRLTADEIRIGDLVTFGGTALAVTFREHRGGVVRLELGTVARVTLAPAVAVTVTRPNRHLPGQPRPALPGRRRAADAPAGRADRGRTGGP